MSGPGVLVRAPGEGRSFRMGTSKVAVLGATSHDGDGFAVIEYEGAPGVPGPPMHVHLAFEECFYILDGEVDFHLAGEVRRVGRGSLVLVPRGAAHTFATAGTAPARWVGILSPATGLGLLEELGELLPAAGPPDRDQLVALFARYQTEIVADFPG